MLHPSSDDYLGENNKTNELSCVLKVSTSRYSMLLTGDIGKKEEEKLVSRLGEKLKSDILIAPHHGSNSSSTWPFLFAVKPDYAIYQVGYLNPYRHPDYRQKAAMTFSGSKRSEPIRTGQSVSSLAGKSVSNCIGKKMSGTGEMNKVFV